MDAEKKMIDQKLINEYKKGSTVGFIVGMAACGAAAVLALIFAPFPESLIAALVAIGVAIPFIVHKVRRREYKVYFVKRTIMKKYVDQRYSEEGGTRDDYCISFGNCERITDIRTYESLNVGDKVYTMHDAINNTIIEVFKAEEYDIDPSLDIRRA